MKHAYTLFEAIDKATHVTVNGREVKKVLPGTSSETRTFVIDNGAGREVKMEFDDQWIELDNEGYGHAFDMEKFCPRLQFRRQVLIPVPLYPLPLVPPPEVQELVTSCLLAMRSLHDDEQWREVGVSLNSLLDQARMLGIVVPN